MKVVFIYRRPSPGGYSIERLFNVIERHVEDVEVVRYELSGRTRLVQDIRRLRNLKADIYHVTGDVNYLVPLLPAGRTVLTIHDLGHYLYGLVGWRRKVYGWLWFSVPLRLAAAVTCVSRATMRDLMASFPGSASPCVVDNCVTAMFQETRGIFNEAHPRILQVGTKPYKNVPRLVQALQGIPCTLVLVGPIDSAVAEALAKGNLNVEHHVNVDEDQLLNLYQGCDVVTFASIGEGFGLPILEAQACGKPLVTSNVPPMSDVAGEGACLVDPEDVSSIRAGLARIIGDEAYRSTLKRDGLINLRRFQPTVIAAKYKDIYSTICMRAV